MCRHFYVCDQNHTIAHFLFNIFLSTKDLIAFDFTHLNILWQLSSICVFAKLKMYWPQNSCTINMLQCLLELASTTTSHVLVQICFFVFMTMEEYLNILVHSLHNMSDADAEKKSIWMLFRKIWFFVSTFMSVHKTHCVCLLCRDTVIHWAHHTVFAWASEHNHKPCFGSDHLYGQEYDKFNTWLT